MILGLAVGFALCEILLRLGGAALVNALNTFLSPLASYQLLKLAVRTRSYRYGGARVREAGLDVYFDFDTSPFDLARPSTSRNFRVVMENLARAASKASDAGADIIFVFIPNRESVYRTAGSRHGVAARFFDVEDRLTHALSSACGEHGWRCVDLTGPFRRQAEMSSQLYYPVDGHWTAAGNALAADALSRYLVASVPSFAAVRGF